MKRGRGSARASILIGLVSLALISLGLRVVGLGWGIPDYDPSLIQYSEYRHSYHLDEDNFLWGLALMHAAGDGDVRVYQWGTLQFFLIDGVLMLGSLLGLVPAPWHRAFLAGDTEALDGLYMLGRTVSVVAGVACTLVVACLGALLAGWRAGLAGGLAYAVAPLAVIGAHYLTNDLTMSALVSGSVLAAVLAVKRGGWGWLALSGLLLGLAVSAKYSAAFSGLALMAGQVLAPANKFAGNTEAKSAYADYGASRRRATSQPVAREFIRRAITLLLPWLAAAIGFVLGTPYALLAPDRLAEGLRQASQGNMLDLSQGLGVPARVLGEQGWSLGWLGLTLPLALLALGGIVVMTTAAARRWTLPVDARVALVLLAGIAGGVVGLALNRVPMLRYWQPLLPLLAVCAGVAWALIPWRVVRWGAGALAVAVALWVTLGQLSIMTGPHPANGLLAWLEANLRPGDRIAQLWPEYPALDAHPYELIRMDPWLPDLPPDARPDYIILDDMAFGPPTERVTTLVERDYREVARFGTYPSVLGIEWDEGRTPHDWKYSHPEFVVYERK